MADSRAPLVHDAGIERSPDQVFAIRAYRPLDRDRIRTISGETAWAGEPGDERIASRYLWAELMTGYYTRSEPEHAWVVERSADGGVFGFLLGAADAGELERYRLSVLPKVALHTVIDRALLDRVRRRTLLSMAGSLAKGELLVPARVKDRFPATFVMAVSAEARGHGMGAVLLDRFLGAMRALQRPGVHVQTNSVNRPVLQIIQRAGFQLAAEWPLTAFQGAVADRLSLLTWVLEI